ncbi:MULTISPECIES: tetratricopeptide repeat protein [Chryseobacterium]|uniref:Sensory histidine kinase UhpB n=1 Tax=Chryseobacterium taihuense TaxID=1141221 RepID=A0A4U8WD70_9FLAO|nr:MULTISPECIES: tetratricopeptide repeat protein [Chryseobacterium]QQV02648.1 tetratricopeptide repeat protein [Chryseobacterium sp. FDAARGOS 1104]VFB04093.1 sensory histidine kinase UhpB [Chryseobacterium taihuense]
MKNILIVITFCLMFSCKKENNDKSQSPTNRDFERALIFSKNGSSDSAFYYFNLSKNDFLDKNDSLGAARALINMAIIQTNTGDFFGGIESSLQTNSLLKFERGIIAKKILTSSYNNIANASNSLRNYDSAIVYYKKAIEYADNNEAKYICYNNIGDALINQGKIKLSKQYLKKAILADSANNYSRALNNFAKAKYLDDKEYNPLPDFNKALAIRQEMKDGAGLNSSYETLSTYYLDKDKELSLQYAKKMLREAVNNNSSDDQITALKRIISLESKYYLQNFKKLDSISEKVQTSRNKAKNQFAVVRYDVEQKNAENKNLKLQKLEDENKILILFGSLLLSILVIVFLRKRQIRLKQEKELEVKNTELRYSKKVHDKVANKVYHVMSEVENTENMNKEVLLYKLDGIYQISRDISYDKNDVILEHNFSQHLSQMLKSYSSENIKVPIIGNEESLWEDVGDYSKVEVFYILQELMTNMKKHSKADKVLIDFSRENDLINIVYSDNGIGISEFFPKNGVQNTESRINSIGGTINFDTKTENGLKITLSFPAKN